MTEKFKKKLTIGERIRESRESAGLTRPGLAKKVDVSLSTLQSWETNQRDPQATTLIKIAEELQVSPIYLLIGEENLIEKQTGEISLNLISPKLNESYQNISDFRNVHVSAGFGFENEEYIEPSYVQIESAWLRERGLKAKDCAMFLVDGDSMEPTLMDEEEIIVDRSKKGLREGKIFVLNHMGKLWVKKVRMGFNGIDLISDNPSYPPISLNQEEANHLQVIGQVVRSHRNF